jgi:subtilisin family serine protease
MRSVQVVMLMSQIRYPISRVQADGTPASASERLSARPAPGEAPGARAGEGVASAATGSLPPMPAPGEPGSFSLADPDRIREILGTAGFGHIEVTPHADQITISEEGITDFAGIALELLRFAGALTDAHQETRAQVLAAIEQGLQARLQAGRVLLSRSVHLVTARS